ncbi:MAG: hypothetical protein ACE37F_26715 [Nannocystaceae bacterium]|nr:hypothetical protein [bacterium]
MGTEVSARGRVVIVVAAVLSLVLSAFGGSAALEATGPERAERMLDQIADLAGLAPSANARAKLPVGVVQEGGPAWVTEAVQGAVQRHPSLELSERGLGLVRVEVVDAGDAIAMRGGLYRQGWNLRSEHPLRMRATLWIPMLALAVGLGAMAYVRRMGVGFAVAGAAAQALDAMVPWPDAFVPVPWTAALRDGPVGRSVVELALWMPDTGVAIGAGVVTLCMVLVAFDHRRSSGKGGAMFATGMAGVLGGILWVEAAARCGMTGWIGTPVGAASILAMALAWGQQGRTLRRP